MIIGVTVKCALSNYAAPSGSASAPMAGFEAGARPTFTGRSRGPKCPIVYSSGAIWETGETWDTIFQSCGTWAKLWKVGHDGKKE